MDIVDSQDKPKLKAERGGDLLLSGQAKVEGIERWRSFIIRTSQS